MFAFMWDWKWMSVVFNRRVGRADPWLLGAVGALCLIGVIMVWSASHLNAAFHWGNPYRFVGKQFAALMLGGIVLAVASHLRIRFIERYLGWVVALTCVLLVAVLAFGIVAGGAPRWLSLWGFFFQPSELAKLAVILYVARALASDSWRVGMLRGVVRPFAFAAMVVGLILYQRDLSTALVVCAVTGLMLFVSGIRLHFLALVAAAVLAFAAFGVSDETYRSGRINAWLDPEAHRTGLGWQPWQSRIAFASGGLTGVGLGKGEQKTGHLPAVHTDFIFAFVAEEFGVVGALFVLVLFGIVGLRGFRIAARHPDPFSSLLAFGLTSLLMIQVVLHVGVTTGLFPTTGLVLPFLSYGGSALVVMLLEVGILSALSRMNG